MPSRLTQVTDGFERADRVTFVMGALLTLLSFLTLAASVALSINIARAEHSALVMVVWGVLVALLAAGYGAVAILSRRPAGPAMSVAEAEQWREWRRELFVSPALSLFSGFVFWSQARESGANGRFLIYVILGSCALAAIVLAADAIVSRARSRQERLKAWRAAGTFLAVGTALAWTVWRLPQLYPWLVGVIVASGAIRAVRGGLAKRRTWLRARAARLAAET